MATMVMMDDGLSLSQKRCHQEHHNNTPPNVPAIQPPTTSIPWLPLQRQVHLATQSNGRAFN